MTIPPVYTITNTHLTLIAQIEANRSSFSMIALPEKLFSNLSHMSLLKSSVYSAQIEGNSLTIDDLQKGHEISEKEYEHQEVENIIAALTLMREKRIPEVLDVPYIHSLHRLVMHKLVHDSHSGILRSEPSAIFDQFGNVIYMTPPPSEIQGLLVSLLALINNPQGLFPLLLAPLVHMTFEKIHPFLDGNGRVGRLLLQAILAKHNYHFNWLLSIEEVLQEKKQTYYTLLDQSDATEFIEFILSVILDESNKLKGKLTALASPPKEAFLLPRRQEILSVIKDHHTVSFDQIKRRFLKIPDRTLRYDIQQLEKEGFIRKIGATRGAAYQVR